MDSLSGRLSEFPSAKKRFLELLKTYKQTPTEGSVNNPQVEFFLHFLLTNPKIKNVLEIGFNGGISSACILSARDDIGVVSLDLAEHDYTLPAKKWIDESFPERHVLVVGDSRVSFPALIRWGLEPDLIFMDGGHITPVPETDLENVLKIAKPNTWIVIDDLRPDFGKDVMTAVEKALQEFKIACKKVYDVEGRTWGVFKKIAE